MKLNLVMILSMVSSMFLAPSFSWADKMGPNGDKFYEAAASFEGACRNQAECRVPFARKVLKSIETRTDEVSAETRQALQGVAFYQAQIWGDTILEGDYVAAGETGLDKVIAYYRADNLLGYKIQYSEKAWSVAECAYDGSEQSLAACEAGRISETSYVSVDMETFFSDEDNYAQFIDQQ